MSDDLFIGLVILPEFRCGMCGAMLSMTSSLSYDPEGVIPHPGDLSICANCCGIGVFSEDGSLRPATSEECERVPMWMREKIAEKVRAGKPS